MMPPPQNTGASTSPAAAPWMPMLWNGEFYVQKVRNPGPGDSIRDRYEQHLPPAVRDGEDQPRYQYGAGCLADQMLGQWFAHVVGLGYLLPEEHVRSATQAIFQHNFRADLSAHDNCQRTYALNGEGGLLASARGPTAAGRAIPSPMPTKCGRASSTR